MRIAFFGDVVGRPGRRAIESVLPRIREEYEIDFFIANVENVSGGIGISEKAIGELERAGVNFFTSGNHVWDKKPGIDLLERRDDIVRPANYPGYPPGRGYRIIEVSGIKTAVINLQGRVFMPHIDCPFQAASRMLQEIGYECRVKIVDFHGEATSEKMAMGWFLDGKVSLLVGTHTHVPTKDARILPQGTGYVTDVGMTGSYDSIIGVEKDAVLEKFLTMRPFRFTVAKKDVRCDVIIADVDEATGKTVSIDHIQVNMEE